MSKRKICEAPGIWAILHIPTNKFVSFDTKCGWGTRSGCKRAWQTHTGKKFAEQEDFKAVHLSEMFYKQQGETK